EQSPEISQCRWLRSALGVLRRPPCLAEPVLLALHAAGVTSEHSRLLEAVPQLGVEGNQGPGDSETESIDLAGDAATLEGGIDVVATLGAGDLHRLHHPHALGHGGEVRLERAAVEGHLTPAFAETYPGDGFLAAAGGLDQWLRHQASTFRIFRSRGAGLWAS